MSLKLITLAALGTAAQAATPAPAPAPAPAASTLACLDYGGNPSAPITADVTIGKVADLKACTPYSNPISSSKTETLYPPTPCKRACPAASTFCFNSYKKGVSVAGGCAAAGSTDQSGQTADGTTQLYCKTEYCNVNTNAVKASAPAPASDASTNALATGFAVAGLIVSLVLM